MKTTSVALGAYFENFIQSTIAQGRYNNAAFGGAGKQCRGVEERNRRGREKRHRRRVRSRATSANVENAAEKWLICFSRTRP